MQLIKLCEMHLITKVYGNTVAVVAKVSEIEKRGNFAQTPNLFKLYTTISKQ